VKRGLLIHSCCILNCECWSYLSKFCLLNGTCGRNYTPSLLLELEEHIVDYLHDDRVALSACALVCRSWVTRSQSQIFSKVLLSNYSANTFAEMLNASPHITRYVKACEVEDAVPENLEPVVPILVNVRHLCISRFWPLDMHMTALIATSFSSITCSLVYSCNRSALHIPRRIPSIRQTCNSVL
jgi:hypothetical protein